MVETDSLTVVVILNAWVPTLGAVVDVGSVDVAVEVGVFVVSDAVQLMGKDSKSLMMVSGALKSPNTIVPVEAVLKRAWETSKKKGAEVVETAPNVRSSVVAVK